MLNCTATYRSRDKKPADNKLDADRELIDLVTAYTEVFKIDNETMKGIVEAENYMNNIMSSVSTANHFNAVDISVHDHAAARHAAVSPVSGFGIGEPFAAYCGNTV